jgi:septum formation protein
MPIILASSSPRRKKILTKLGYNFKVVNPQIDESNSLKLNPLDYVEYISKLKARKVFDSFNQFDVIAADTIIEFQNKIIGKPKNKDHAKEIFFSLSNKSHNVITSLTFKNREIESTITDSSKITFKYLSEDLIDYYIQNFNVLDKAGGYNIEQSFFKKNFVKDYEGCFENITGFPITMFFEKKIDKFIK